MRALVLQLFADRGETRNLTSFLDAIRSIATVVGSIATAIGEIIPNPITRAIVTIATVVKNATGPTFTEIYTTDENRFVVQLQRLDFTRHYFANPMPITICYRP